jgi:hypothetical protein
MPQPLSGIGRYLGDKFVDQIVGVLFTFGFTAGIAAIQQLIFPTIPLGYVFLIMAVAALLGAFVVALVRSRFGKKATRLTKEAFPQIPLIEPSEKTISDSSPEQRKLLKLGFHSLVQRQLTEIEKQLDSENPRPVEFKAWNDPPEDVRKQYVDDLRTYETIEKIAKVVDTWNEAVNRAGLLRVQPSSGTIYLCIQSFREYHDELKHLGFLI